jgi:hypothetical protein
MWRFFIKAIITSSSEIFYLTGRNIPMITRRSCLKLLGFSALALALPVGCRRSTQPRLDPGAVLADLRRNEVIGQLRDCQLTFHPKHIEKLSERGKEALTIVQRGLFSLGFISADPATFNFGVYGPQTTAAVEKLYLWGRTYEDGEHFDCRALRLLEKGLEAKISGER